MTCIILDILIYVEEIEANHSILITNYNENELSKLFNIIMNAQCSLYVDQKIY